ncbi:MAG: fluoride efflux transporter CrcB [Rectinema sp.]|nr:fluoride efflux transporter CrcB [Rectinema sp.]
MRETLLVFLGGGLGALARYAFSRGISARFFTAVPMGTLFVNVSGSLIMGFFFSLLNEALLPSGYRALITVGFIGAYTTFSTYMLETVVLLQKREYMPALFNFLYNNVFCLIAVLAGMLLATALMLPARNH